MKLTPHKFASPMRNQLQNQFSARLAPTDAFGHQASSHDRRQGRSSLDAAGDTKATATALGIFPSTRTVRESVSRSDSDFYSFTIDAVSNVKVSFLNRSPEPIYKAVLNENGSFYVSQRKPQSGNIAPREETLSTYRRLRPGTYYIKLQSRTAVASSYKLSVAITTTPPEVDCGCGG